MANLANYSGAAFITASGLAVAANATIEVRRVSDGALATIYSDEAGTVGITNPSAFADASGRFSFYALGIKRGYSIKITKGAENWTLNTQAIGTASQDDATAFADTLLAAADAPSARALLNLKAENAQSLVELLHVDYDTAHRDLAKKRWDPAFFNQQWGGAPHYFELLDAATGVPYRFEAATGYLDDSTSVAAGDAAARTGNSQGFKVSKTTTLQAMWVKVYKIGNPANNLELRIQADDGTGKPTANFTAITNGTATAQGGKLFTADAIGQWHRFVFATPPSLTAGTQYHITLKSSGVVDAANYWIWKGKASKNYPHGNICQGDATPAWTATTTQANLFLAEVVAADQALQTGGVFGDGKYNFFEGTPLDQSSGRVKSLREFEALDLTDFTLLVRGAAWTKDKTIIDILYGVDHDRVVLRANVTTGFAQVDVYDSAGAKKTVTATSVDLSSGTHDVAVRVRAKGDGADAVGLWVDGAANGTQLASQTISFDRLFGLARLGTFWLGGGWAVAPAWTAKAAMTVLPSADSPAWTYTGTPAEGTAFSVSGGKLFQNKNGYGSTDLGHYQRITLGFANATGWAVASRERTVSADNGAGADFSPVTVIDDGTKQFAIGHQEYFTASLLAASADAYFQGDNKAAENVNLLIGKGSDSFLFINGRLALDGTGRMTMASASNGMTANSVRFGDSAGGAGQNSDAVWDYVTYNNATFYAPQFTSGALSELAIWDGDRTALLAALWNTGTPWGVKQFSGLNTNYVGGDLPMKVQLHGITSNPTTTSTANPPTVLVPEMEMFVIGVDVYVDGSRIGIANSTAGTNYAANRIDGVLNDRDSNWAYSAGGTQDPRIQKRALLNFGLHKLDVTWGASGGTLTATNQRRVMLAEGRS